MRFLPLLLLLVSCITQATENEDFISEKDKQASVKKDSPWLITPTVSSDPKISTSVGALIGYVHSFDEASPASMFGATGAYSSSDSYYYGLFAKTYFKQDMHRLSFGAFNAFIKNDYDDYLGTGLPAKTEDDMAIIALRYQYQVWPQFYLGVQGVSSDYAVNPGDVLSGIIIEKVGLTGFKSNALGIIATYDTRNNQNTPTAGGKVEFNNLAYRETFGGDENFDTYNLSAQYYWQTHQKFITAMNLKGRWSVDAPISAYSSVPLRGYIRGQYVSEHMTMVEVEERINLYKKLGASVFTGVAWLYGDSATNSDESEYFPAVGIALTYQLNEEKMVVRAEAAMGKSNNKGFYLQFGQPF